MNNDLKLNDVDTLGALLAQIKDLTDQAEAIKDAIKDSAKGRRCQGCRGCPLQSHLL